MNHIDLAELIGDDVRPVRLRCMSVEYVFDHCLRGRLVAGRRVYEIGRNDVSVPIVVDPRTKNVYFLADGELSFINSTYQQMLASFSQANDLKLPETASDSEAAAIFERLMQAIDRDCFRDRESIWSVMREEIANGLL